MHLKTVLVFTVGNIGSVSDKFEVDEITESVDADEELAADAGLMSGSPFLIHLLLCWPSILKGERE